MSVSFLNVIIFFLVVHLTSSAQFITKEQFIREIMKINDKMSFMMDQFDSVLNINRTNDVKLEDQLKKLNETVAILENNFRGKENDFREKLKAAENETKMLISKLNETENILQKLVKDVKTEASENTTEAQKMVEQVEINSNEINRLRQWVKILRKDSGQQDKCDISQPTQLYNLSPDTLIYTWKNLNLSEVDIRNEPKEIKSEVFSIPQLGLNAQGLAKIYNSGSVYSFTYFTKKRQSSTLTTKINPRLYSVIKQEYNGQTVNTYVQPTYYYKHINSSLRYDYFHYQCYFSHLYAKPEIKYEAGETFSMEVHMDTPEMLDQFYSDNGTVKGTICPYEMIRKWTGKGQVDYIHSPVFYTSPKGYRVELLLRLNHRDNSHLMEVYSKLLPGPYDSFLKNPEIRGTISIINQKDTNKRVTEVVSQFWRLVYIPSNLSEFVMNDQLMYEASVQVVG